MRNYKIEEMIKYEDQEIIVCYKPAGLAVQNARFGVMDMESLLKNYLAGKNQGKEPYLGMIHRLDQPVEGVLVFGKNQGAARELSRQMAAGEMGKQYLAVTFEKPKKKEEKLVDYLKKDGRTNTSYVVENGTPGSKRASLVYQWMEETDVPERKYLLGIKLETGRHHQIRVQMAHAGLPLIGDRKYHPEGKTDVSLGLCSWCLELQHPVTGKKMHFEIQPQGMAFAGFSKISE